MDWGRTMKAPNTMMIAVGALALTATTLLAGCGSTATTAASTPATAESPAPPSGAPESAAPEGGEQAAVVNSDQFDAYMELMSGLGDREATLLERYEAVSGENYTDDATMYSALIELLPDVQAFIADLEGASPPAGPIAAAHEVVVEGWNLQSEGMTLAASAIEKQDLSVMAQGNEKLADGRAKLRVAQSQMAAAMGSLSE